METSLVNAYLKQTNEIFSLSLGINEITSSLDSAQDELLKFKKEITDLSNDMENMIADTESSSIKLNELKVINGKLRDFLENSLPSHQLLQGIDQDDINDHFLTCVEELCAKLVYVDQLKDTNVKTLPLITAELNNLKLKVHLINKAVTKSRSFLNDYLNLVKGPNANVSVIQNQLLRFKSLFWFLMEHYNSIGVEYHLNYVRFN